MIRSLRSTFAPAVIRHLTAIRHAKSSWANPDWDDRDRPLNRRGRESAPRVAQALVEHNLIPDACICSPALRALHTCSLMSRQFGVDAWSIDERLYSGGVQHWHQLICDVPDSVDHLMLFAHMPTIADFCTQLGGPLKQKFSTAAACTLAFKLDRWANFGGCGRRVSFLFPKGL